MAMLNNLRVYHVISSKSSPQYEQSQTATAKRLKAYCKFQKLLGNPKPEGYTAQKDPDNLSSVCHGQVTSWIIVVYGHPTRDFLQWVSEPLWMGKSSSSSMGI